MDEITLKAITVLVEESGTTAIWVVAFMQIFGFLKALSITVVLAWTFFKIVLLITNACIHDASANNVRRTLEYMPKTATPEQVGDILSKLKHPPDWK